MAIKLSLIMVYSNIEQKDQALLWIKKQSLFPDVELILLDNRNNCKFSSAAKALNYGASISQGDVLVFMHQDIYLWDEDILLKYYDFLSLNKNVIAGVAGANYNGPIISDICETNDKLYRYQHSNGAIIEVDSVDECMFGMSKKLWKELMFDEICCDNWHCYALEICLKNALNKGRNVIISADICHESIGNPEQASFVYTVGKIVKKYRKTSVAHVKSCCVEIKCTLRSYYYYLMKYYVKTVLKCLKIR